MLHRSCIGLASSGVDSMLVTAVDVHGISWVWNCKLIVPLLHSGIHNEPGDHSGLSPGAPARDRPV